MRKINLIKTIAAIVFVSLSSTAGAYVLTNDPDCAGAAAVFNPDYDACVGAYLLEGGENDVTDGAADNIVNQILNVDDVFGVEDWTFLGKEDDSASSSFFDVIGIDDTSGSIVFDDLAINAALGPDFLTTYDVAVSFKSANNFSIYQWDASLGSNTIDWTTDGTATNNQGNAQDLSHASVYLRNSIPVPEPAPFALLGLGLVGLGLSRRKK